MKPPPASESDPERRHAADERRLKRVIEWSMTLSVGAMAGFFASIRRVNPELEFRFDWLTLLALLAGGWMGHLFWRVIPRDTPGAPRGAKRWLPLGLWLAVQFGAMIFTFGYGMKDLSGEKYREVLIGTGLAVVVLTFVAFLLWRVGKFFEDSHRNYLKDHPDQHD
ncbi:MAG TPA: hypothetical protein VLD18_16810 [Verrucomicrobiae bacterium]|nr:hypothetical protein [Verrucomicrobiae bacterium]